MRSHSVCKVWAILYPVAPPNYLLQSLCHCRVQLGHPRGQGLCSEVEPLMDLTSSVTRHKNMNTKSSVFSFPTCSNHPFSQPSLAATPHLDFLCLNNGATCCDLVRDSRSPLPRTVAGCGFVEEDNGFSWSALWRNFCRTVTWLLASAKPPRISPGSSWRTWIVPKVPFMSMRHLVYLCCYMICTYVHLTAGIISGCLKLLAWAQ